MGDTLNITCNFMCCNHQVCRDFLITLYNIKILWDHCHICSPLLTETWFCGAHLYINVHMQNINGKFDFVWVVLLEVMACKIFRGFFFFFACKMIVYWYHNNEQYFLL